MAAAHGHMHGPNDNGVDGSNRSAGKSDALPAPVYAMTEQEQLRLRMHQVESSVLKIHELCYTMAAKIGVAGAVLETHKPQLVSEQR